MVHVKVTWNITTEPWLAYRTLPWSFEGQGFSPFLHYRGKWYHNMTSFSMITNSQSLTILLACKSHSQSFLEIQVFQIWWLRTSVGGGPEKPPASLVHVRGDYQPRILGELSCPNPSESERPGMADNLGTGEGPERSLPTFLTWNRYWQMPGGGQQVLPTECACPD